MKSSKIVWCLTLTAFLLVQAEISTAAEVETEQGRYLLAVELTEGPAHVGSNTVRLRLRDREGGNPVKEALTIEIVPWMPMHEHGVTKAPVVKPEGNGEYLVEQVNFSMPGDWELYFRMTGHGIEDNAVVDVKVLR